MKAKNEVDYIFNRFIRLCPELKKIQDVVDLNYFYAQSKKDMPKGFSFNSDWQAEAFFQASKYKAGIIAYSDTFDKVRFSDKVLIIGHEFSHLLRMVNEDIGDWDIYDEAFHDYRGWKLAKKAKFKYSFTTLHKCLATTLKDASRFMRIDEVMRLHKIA